MSNPILSRTELETNGNPLTINGVIHKTVLLLAICAISALGVYFYGMSTGMSQGTFYAICIGGFVATLITGFIMMFKPASAKALAIPYSVFEGLLVGGLSGAVMFIYPSVPATALCATFITAAGMLALYRSGLISVTDKFRSIVTSATIAIMILYAVTWVLKLAFGTTIPLLFDGGIIAIGFSLFVIVIASFNLLLDFDNIEQAAEMGVSEDMEWVLGVGLLMTLVWMFIEFVRLLGFLED